MAKVCPKVILKASLLLAVRGTKALRFTGRVSGRGKNGFIERHTEVSLTVGEMCWRIPKNRNCDCKRSPSMRSGEGRR